MDELLRPLSAAFWVKVMEELVEGQLLTYVWLYTGHGPADYLWWCDVTDKDPDVWRGYLVKLWELRGTEAGKRALKMLREGA